jgi:hypothetical protein
MGEKLFLQKASHRASRKRAAVAAKFGRQSRPEFPASAIADSKVRTNIDPATIAGPFSCFIFDFAAVWGSISRQQFLRAAAEAATIQQEVPRAAAGAEKWRGELNPAAVEAKKI